MIAVLYVDLSSSVSSYTEKSLLNDLSEGIASGMNRPNISSDLHQLIGNEMYIYSDVTGTVINKEVCITPHVRIKGDYAIVINITSETPEKNHSIATLIDSFE